MSLAPAEPELSIVVPALNEEEALPETHRRLTQILSAIGDSYEIVFVDDGSTDGTRGLMAAIAQADPHVRAVILSRNFGHELATTAGLRYARGRAVVVLDADLQDPPELIPEFLRLWREGNQVVYGVRRERQGETLLKKATSFAFYRLLGKISDVPIPADTGDFRLMDRCVLNAFNELSEDPRFFRGLISWVGFRQIGVEFERQPRVAGVSKYRYGRLLRLALDTITAFSTYPSYIVTITALVVAGLSALLGFVVALGALAGSFQVPPWGWCSLGFLALFNIQFLSLAVFGEYLVRTHRHTQRRPLFVVDSILGGTSDRGANG